jgi:hypothetical protein
MGLCFVQPCRVLDLTKLLLGDVTVTGFDISIVSTYSARTSEERPHNAAAKVSESDSPPFPPSQIHAFPGERSFRDRRGANVELWTLLDCQLEARRKQGDRAGQAMESLVWTRQKQPTASSQPTSLQQPGQARKCGVGSPYRAYSVLQPNALLNGSGVMTYISRLVPAILGGSGLDFAPPARRKNKAISKGRSE